MAVYDIKDSVSSTCKHWKAHVGTCVRRWFISKQKIENTLSAPPAGQ